MWVWGVRSQIGYFFMAGCIETFLSNKLFIFLGRSLPDSHHQMPSVVPTVTVTCEGSYLTLSCAGSGHVLKIKRALFGRITPVQCVVPVS